MGRRRRHLLRDYSLHHSDLFALLSAQVAIIAQDEEGAEIRATHERAARKIEGNEADRSAHERVADGATAPDEGSKSARWMFAFADSDAVSVCALHGADDLDRFPAGDVFVDSRFVGAGALHPQLHSHPANPV